MNLPPSISSRRETERVIAAARVALASAALFGVWMDPTEPVRYVPITYTLYVVYVVYALLLLALILVRRVDERLPLITHVGDIIFVSVLQYLTLGPSSPFFLYFVFSLFCGALRWGWQGTLATAGVVLATYILMGATMSRELGPTEFEFDRFVTRSVYLMTTSGLLVYLGLYEARLRGEIERLARWPAAGGTDSRQIIEELIEHAAAIMGAGRAVAIWDAGDEPAIRVARWSAEGAFTSTHPPATLTSTAGPDVGDATFLLAGQVSASARLLVSGTNGRLDEAHDLTIHADVLPWLAGVGLASAAFKTERVEGRVFFTDLGTPAAEIVPLTEVVARQIGASLDQLFVTEQTRAIAASEERIRVARDSARRRAAVADRHPPGNPRRRRGARRRAHHPRSPVRHRARARHRAARAAAVHRRSRPGRLGAR